MKVHFVYKFQNGPWGGGNQFLKALRDALECTNNLATNAEDADVILFNAHQHAASVIGLRNSFPNKIFAHRMDGLYKLYNTPTDKRQDVSIKLNEIAADCTIFQNEWSRQGYIKDNLKTDKPYAIISNAPDKELFHSNYKKSKSDKIRLVCTSWSINKNKGFDYYKYLDNNLDFNKYSFTYIGNDPKIKFKNIKKIGPLDSTALAKELREYDIFITASKYECCSNSLLEALSTGLPAVGLHSGGTPEIINKGGELFKSKDEALISIDKVSDNLEQYKSNISVQSITKISKYYLDFFSEMMYNSSI